MSTDYVNTSVFGGAGGGKDKGARKPDKPKSMSGAMEEVDEDGKNPF